MKNDILNFKRFGRYFAADFMNGLSNFGLSALVCSLVGIMVFIFTGFIGTITGQGWLYSPALARTIAFVLMMAVILIVGPTKLYGKITDKKEGSFFLTIPASSFEKHASMILNAAVIFPAITALAYLIFDAILCLIFPGCGDGLLFTAGSLAKDALQFITNDMPEELNGIRGLFNPILYIDDLIQFALIFLLGAICFKKSKAAKTILVLIAFSMAMSSIMSPIMLHGMGQIVNDADAINFITNKAGWFFNNATLIDWISDTLMNCALAGAIYYRVKTLKF